MGCREYRFSKEQREELEAALAECEDVNCYKRLEILVWRARGKDRLKVAELSGFHPSHISTITGRYMKEGLEAVATERRPGGNHRNLSDDEEHELLETFRKEAEAGHLITAGEMKAEYEKKVGHAIGNGTIYRFLERHGWRKVKPRGKHPKAADSEAIEASKKLKLVWKS